MADQHTYYNAVAFISDIHSNLEALEAVLQDIEAHKVTAIYCLGDIVGYGPNPVECLDRLIELEKSGKLVRVICGNHDHGVYHDDYEKFNQTAKESNSWTRERLLHKSGFDFLEKLAQTDMIQDAGKFTLVHSTLKPNPLEWSYLRTKNANENFMARRIVFVGHSHVPAVYSAFSSGKGWNPITLFESSGYYFYPTPKKEKLAAGKAATQYRLTLPDAFPTMLINVGSVGQPRDNNPSARYVLYISVDYKNYIEYRQVGYDVQKTVHKHKERSLECDQKLATRLVTGGHSSFDQNSPKPSWFPFD